MLRKRDIDARIIHSIEERAFPHSGEPRFEREASGGSTQVYRIDWGGEPVYLRFAERAGESLAPDAAAHRLLRERGVLAPEVLFHEEAPPEIDQAVMITAAMPGEPFLALLNGRRVAPTEMHGVLHETGRQLALMQDLAVDGFGLITRDRPWSGQLTGSYPAFGAWMEAEFAAISRLSRYVSTQELDAITACVRCVTEAGTAEGARLAHGDFDLSHIFQQNGRYTGIIDFGEIRGADRWFDLAELIGRFDSQLAAAALPSLLAGFRELRPLEPDDLELIRMRAITLAARMLIRTSGLHRIPYEQRLVRSIRSLLPMGALKGMVATG